MTFKPLPLSEELLAYCVAHSTPAEKVVDDVIAETRTSLESVAQMQIAPEQAAFMTMLVRLVGVSHAVEVGTFTGLSSLAIARGLRDGGRLVCLDISEEYTAVARRYWAAAGVTDRIELRIAPAAESLRELPAEPYLDFAFIDADKRSYPTYWAEIVPRLRPGGVVVVDNVLRGGDVVGSAPQGVDTEAMRRFNDDVLRDERVEIVMLPIADGLTLAHRR